MRVFLAASLACSLGERSRPNTLGSGIAGEWYDGFDRALKVMTFYPWHQYGGANVDCVYCATAFEVDDYALLDL